MAVKRNTNPAIQQSKPLKGGEWYKAKPEPPHYRERLIAQLPTHGSVGFLEGPDGSGTLEYIVALDRGDLSLGLGLPLSTSGEERAYRLLKDWMPELMPGFEGGDIRLFFKHTMQSLMGTHWILGLEAKGSEIEEHSFVVHLDRQNRIVMVCCTYLPDLPELLKGFDAGDFPKEENIQQAIDDEIDNLGEYDQADAENMWLLIWNREDNVYQAVPGSQVKVSLPRRKAKTGNPADVLGVTENKVVKGIHNAPGLASRKLGFGEVIRDFSDKKNSKISSLNDDAIKDHKIQGMLLDLESTSELVGRYVSVKDQIAVYQREKNGIFLGEKGSYFDRVNAYYHLDYIQRYFRDKLGLSLLDEYDHLNPVRVVLTGPDRHPARYDVNGQQITFSRLGMNPLPFTAARDPRVIYHEFVHMVTDAIARLHRAGRLITPRASAALQAQAMDEGVADYFACSLAAQQGAKKPLFYYRIRHNGASKWAVRRNLDLDLSQKVPPEHIDTRQLGSDATWNGAKYHLAERWGQYLWQLHLTLKAELTDMLIVHSLFFLTRWATFAQGYEAIQLADRLLFGASHEPVIREKYGKVMGGITFEGIPFPAMSQSPTGIAQ